MAGVNKVILIGRLGQDPEVRATAKGTSVCNFSLATSETWTKDGNKEERTEWHRIVMFGKLAEICGQYLTKGSQVYIEGKLQTRHWEDKEGNKRYTTEVVGYNMQMLSAKQGNRSSQQDSGYNQPQDNNGPPQYDNDIPF